MSKNNSKNIASKSSRMFIAPAIKPVAIAPAVKLVADAVTTATLIEKPAEKKARPSKQTRLINATDRFAKFVTKVLDPEKFGISKGVLSCLGSFKLDVLAADPSVFEKAPRVKAEKFVAGSTVFATPKGLKRMFGIELGTALTIISIEGNYVVVARPDGVQMIASKKHVAAASQVISTETK